MASKRSCVAGNVAPLERDVANAEFSALYAAQAHRVRGYVRARIKSAQDADDLTQTIMTAFYEQWDRVEPRRRVDVLFLIATNKINDYRRARSRCVVTLVPEPRPDEADHNADPATIAVRNDTDRLVHAAVARTTRDHQRLLHGRYVERRPFNELAGEFGRTSGALRNMHQRALESVAREVRALGVRVILVCAASSVRARRADRRACVAAVGQGTLVSLVATTMVMAPPAAVPAAADLPRPSYIIQSGPQLTAVRLPEPTAEVTTPAAERQVALRTTGDDGRAPTRSPLRRRVIETPNVATPKAPCVGRCLVPSEHLTLHVPMLGDIRRDQNVAPLCDEVPSGQPVATCEKDEGTNYSVPPPPHP